jgi:hypothetical protein
MYISNNDGCFFDFSIVGYQYPYQIKTFWDDWIIIHINASTPQGSWTIEDPCMTVFEAKRLVDWFEEIFLGFPHQLSCGFTEPYIEFENITQSDEQLLRIIIRSRFLPPWQKRMPDSDNEIFLDIPFSQISFQKLINDLLGEIQKVPPRIIQERYSILIRNLPGIETNRVHARIKDELSVLESIKISSVRYIWDSDSEYLRINFYGEYPAYHPKEKVINDIRECIQKSLDVNDKFSSIAVDHCFIDIRVWRNHKDN